jgi:tetratricopeptide (TPR) repeat protein
MATNWQTGDRIRNRWEIHHILRGGIGITYVVYDHELHEALAVKTLPDEVLARQAAIGDRFKQEARSWLNLTAHQNVAQARLVEIIEGKPFLFLEYISGGDLSGWIGTPRLTENLSQVLRFAIQFCDGITHLLSAGLKAHRDIKPQNCLITLDRTLKVTDFGLVKAFDDASPTEQESESTGKKEKSLGGLLGKLPGRRKKESDAAESAAVKRLSQAPIIAVGTPQYMAPEQFNDAKTTDARADIYSFGVVLFQMATGKLPFVGDTWQQFERLHKTEPVPPLGSQSAALKPVVETCLAKDPARRFANFGAVRQALADIYGKLTGEPAPDPITGAELDAWQLLNKGAGLSQLGRHQEAISCYDRALELDPGLESAWTAKGVALGELKRLKEALTCYDRTLELNPDSADALSNKGVILRALKRIEEATACYDRALELNPYHADAQFNRAAALRALKQTEEAIACYDRALQLNPRHAKAWSHKGALLMQSGQIEESVACYDRATQLNPRDIEAWTNRGAALAELGKFDEEIVCYDRILQINPNHERAWTNKGAALLALARLQEALDCFDRALEINPNRAEIWSNKGVALGAFGRHGEEIVCYDRALELTPEMEQLWVNKGVALRELGQTEEAIACYDRALELNADFAGAWASKGVALSAVGRFKEAVTCYDRALELEPNNADTWSHKGAALGDALGKWADSLICYDRAIDLNPGHWEAWHNKGMALGALGRYEEAVVCYTRAIELNPNDAESLINKGAALSNFGRYHEALVCFEEAQRLGHPLAPQAVALARRKVGGGKRA